MSLLESTYCVKGGGWQSDDVVEEFKRMIGLDATVDVNRVKPQNETQD